MSSVSRAGLLIVPCLLTTFGVGAQESLDLEQLRIPYEKIVLSNGLTVLVHEDHSVPIVAVNLWYHVGSKNEQRGRTGFAHLFEHFFFNGSENHPSGFREAMDDIGANNRNGTTSTDRTNFFEDVPVSGLERTLYLEADRMGFLANHISEEMLERERGVVKNEKRQGENQPYGRVFSRIVESIYPYSHPYSWSTIGSMADLDAASLEDVKEWYGTYYGPNNCVLSLAGDITVEQARELVEKYFGSIPPGPPIARYEKWVPRLEQNLRDEMEDRVPQDRIYRVYRVPGWGETDTLLLELTAEVLSGSKSARLDRRLVYDRELVTDVAAFVWDKEVSGDFLIMATVKTGVDPLAAEKELDAVLAEFLDQGPSPEELKRARTRIVADFIRGIERLGGFGGRSDVLAQSATFGGDPEAYLSHLRLLHESTTDDVRAASQRWLDAPHYTLTVRPYPELAADKETIDRSVLPGLGEPPEVTFPEVQVRELANGLTVLLLERHSAPMVNMTLAVDAGYAADPSSLPGTASLALDQMKEGTINRDAFQIVDELDALGAEIDTGSSLDQSFVRLRALSMNLGKSLEVFSDVVLYPSFPAEMVELGKRRRVAQIGQEKAQPMAMGLRVAPKLLYGEGHAYANPYTGSGYVDTVEQLDREQLASWHDAWFHPNHSSLIVAGDVTMDRLLPMVEKAFGAWSEGEPPTKNLVDVTAREGARVYLIDKPDAPQSVLVAAHVSRQGGLPQDLAMEVVIRAFGRMSTSRLMRNLRLEKHWTYGAFSLLADARGQRPFMVITSVQADTTSEAMAEILKEVKGIAGEQPIVGEEFASIMRNMTLRLPGRFETLGSLETAAVDLVNYGYPPEYFYDYAENVRSLTEEDLAAAAAEYIEPDELLWIVVGDLAQVEAGIRGLGLGDTQRLDADGRPVAE